MFSVGEENKAVAAIQEYTKTFCKNTPEVLTGEIKPDEAQETKDLEIRKEIAKMAISNME